MKPQKSSRQTFHVLSCSGSPESDRLRIFGVVPGATITYLRSAPFGDPVQVEVEGCRLSIPKKAFESLSLEQSPDSPFECLAQSTP